MSEQQLTSPIAQDLVGETQPLAAVPAIEYAEGVDQLSGVEVDAGYFGQLMAQKGMSEADIAATTIRMTADLETTRGKTRKEEDTIAELGYHDPTTDTAGVNVASIKHAVNGIEKINGPFEEGQADDLRVTEINEAQLNPNHEHYDSSPRERRIEEQTEEIMGQFEYVDDYPIQIRFKQPATQAEAAA